MYSIIKLYYNQGLSQSALIFTIICLKIEHCDKIVLKYILDMKKMFFLIILIILSVTTIFFMAIFFNKSDMNKNNINNSLSSSTNQDIVESLTLSSNAFKNNQPIPEDFSYKGKNINPPLFISNVPGGTKTLVLIVDDPDAPSRTYVHWLVWNIPKETISIESGFLPEGSIQGLNDFNDNKYDGPYPPSGTHRYFFKLYAIDTFLNLTSTARKGDLEASIKGHVLGEASLVGLYSK